MCVIEPIRASRHQSEALASKWVPACTVPKLLLGRQNMGWQPLRLPPAARTGSKYRFSICWGGLGPPSVVSGRRPGVAACQHVLLAVGSNVGQRDSAQLWESFRETACCRIVPVKFTLS